MAEENTTQTNSTPSGEQNNDVKISLSNESATLTPTMQMPTEQNPVAAETPVGETVAELVVETPAPVQESMAPDVEVPEIPTIQESPAMEAPVTMETVVEIAPSVETVVETIVQEPATMQAPTEEIPMQQATPVAETPVAATPVEDAMVQETGAVQEASVASEPQMQMPVMPQRNMTKILSIGAAGIALIAVAAYVAMQML